jgi:hypothetical protein
MHGERILWAGTASSRLARRNLGLVLMAGLSLSAVVIGYGRATNWENGLGLAAVLVLGLTGFFAYLSLELPGIFMLTDRQAYALYRVPTGDMVYAYEIDDLAPVLIRKAWLVPSTGNVCFGNAAERARKAIIEGQDPGPCGFLSIDYPVRVAELIDSTVEKRASIVQAEGLFRFQ